jgi:hypothetical protein
MPATPGVIQCEKAVVVVEIGRAGCSPAPSVWRSLPVSVALYPVMQISGPNRTRIRRIPENRKQTPPLVRMRAVCGPREAGEPVITLMMLEED